MDAPLLVAKDVQRRLALGRGEAQAGEVGHRRQLELVTRRLLAKVRRPQHDAQLPARLVVPGSSLVAIRVPRLDTAAWVVSPAQVPLLVPARLVLAGPPPVVAKPGFDDAAWLVLLAWGPLILPDRLLLPAASLLLILHWQRELRSRALSLRFQPSAHVIGDA